MSSCCCHVSASAMASMAASARLSAQIQPPNISAKLSAIASLAVGMNPERPDLKLALIAPRLPNVSIALSPPLVQVAAMLSVSTYSFVELPKLEAQLHVMANSINNMVTPGFSACLAMDISALMDLSIAAQMILDLKVAGLDPLEANFSESVGNMVAAAPSPPSIGFALTAPQVGNIKILAGLPPLINAYAALNIPLGDPNAGAAFMARISAVASITPPTLSVSLSATLRIAAMVSAVAKIVAAFGVDAFTSTGQSRIEFMLKAVASIAIPIPSVDLGKLEMLPPFDDVVLGAEIAGSSSISASINVSPPAIPISAFISASVALQASLSAAVNVPPVDYCMDCRI